jgi:hydroxyacylglutathione hydrolase
MTTTPFLKWFEGVNLLGQFNGLRAGCWLLVHGDTAAVLEMPPYDEDEPSPAEQAAAAAKSLNVTVRFLFCTHAHWDHFCEGTLEEMRHRFPAATICLQRGFAEDICNSDRIRWFDDLLELSLGGEPLFLIHAPKHSVTDTMVVFRGTICTGDWELRTIRSVHDSRSGITTQQKLSSINRLIDFVSSRNYRIHQLYSVHANDRQEGVNFVELMNDTRF